MKTRQELLRWQSSSVLLELFVLGGISTEFKTSATNGLFHAIAHPWFEKRVGNSGISKN
ncbi:MAG: hypothetical protein WAK17_26875 [Candidatus Nitrosopolaris sp.]